MPYTEVSPEEVEQHFKSYTEVSGEDVEKALAGEVEDEGPGMLESVALGGIQGITMQFADEAFALAKTTGRLLTEGMMGLPKYYDKEVDKAREVFKRAEEAHPTAYAVSEFAGGAIGALAPTPAKIGALPTLAKAAGTGAIYSIGAAEEDLTEAGLKGAAATAGIVGGFGLAGKLGKLALKPAIKKAKELVDPVKNYASVIGATKKEAEEFGRTKGISEEFLSAAGVDKSKYLSKLEQHAAVERVKNLQKSDPEIFEVFSKGQLTENINRQIIKLDDSFRKEVALLDDVLDENITKKVVEKVRDVVEVPLIKTETKMVPTYVDFVLGPTKFEPRILEKIVGVDKTEFMRLVPKEVIENKHLANIMGIVNKNYLKAAKEFSDNPINASGLGAAKKNVFNPYFEQLQKVNPKNIMGSIEGVRSALYQHSLKGKGQGQVISDYTLMGERAAAEQLGASLLKSREEISNYLIKNKLVSPSEAFKMKEIGQRLKNLYSTQNRLVKAGNKPLTEDDFTMAKQTYAASWAIDQIFLGGAPFMLGGRIVFEAGNSPTGRLLRARLGQKLMDVTEKKAQLIVDKMPRPLRKLYDKGELTAEVADYILKAANRTFALGVENVLD